MKILNSTLSQQVSILILFAGLTTSSIQAQTERIDSTKKSVTINTKQEVAPKHTKTPKTLKKCDVNQDRNNNNEASFENGFLFKRNSISQL